MIRINLAVPLLAKNARNGAPSSFVMEKWATRLTRRFVDFLLPAAPRIQNGKMSRGKHLITPPFPKSGKSGAAVLGRAQAKDQN
jgi:hypothetical protein